MGEQTDRDVATGSCSQQNQTAKHKWQKDPRSHLRGECFFLQVRPLGMARSAPFLPLYHHMGRAAIISHQMQPLCSCSQFLARQTT